MTIHQPSLRAVENTFYLGAIHILRDTLGGGWGCQSACSRKQRGVGRCAREQKQAPMAKKIHQKNNL